MTWQTRALIRPMPTFSKEQIRSRSTKNVIGIADHDARFGLLWQWQADDHSAPGADVVHARTGHVTL
jgi:hypothetical protein